MSVVDSGMSDVASDRMAESLLCILAGLGRPLGPAARVLELGCGNGELVHALRSRGKEAYGCDLLFKEGRRTSSMREAGMLRIIETHPYRLPFPDATFDLVVSVSVLEHVMNITGTVRELSRVTKNGGGGLHLFPSRYRPIEPHTYVPLGTLLRSRWWLHLWASLGVKNSFQTEMKVPEVANANYQYLRSATNYLTRSEIRRAFETEFAVVDFREDLAVSCAAGSRSNRLRLGAAMQASRMLTWLYSETRERAIWLQKSERK